jgi:protein TonB
MSQLQSSPAAENGTDRLDAGGGDKRAETPFLSAGAQATNVIPFAKRHERGDTLRLDAVARPAPSIPPLDRPAWMLALVAGSLLAHAGIYWALNRDPPPLASIGIESISVEIVLGSDLAAGPVQEQGQSEEERPEQADPNLARTEPAEQPPEEPEQRAEPEQPPEPALASVEEPRLLTAPPAAQTVAAQPAPAAKPAEPKREAVPSRSKAVQHPARERHAMLPANPAPAATAAGGVGRGRSDADSNYRGLVAAHLARYKRFPADARSRGDQGIAAVSFSLDASGRVTSVALARASGVSSLDQEVQAMVRRASPFPAPPGGRAMAFTVPISFRLQ